MKTSIKIQSRYSAVTHHGERGFKLLIDNLKTELCIIYGHPYCKPRFQTKKVKQ